MINLETYAMLEALLFFGGLIGFLLWQSWDVDRAIKKRQAEEAGADAASEPAE